VRHPDSHEFCIDQFRYDAALSGRVEIGVSGDSGALGGDDAGLEHLDAVGLHLRKLLIVTRYNKSEMMDTADAFRKHIRICALIIMLYLNELDLHTALECQNDIFFGADGLAPIDSLMLNRIRSIPLSDIEELFVIGHGFRNVLHKDADLVDAWKIHLGKSTYIRKRHDSLLSNLYGFNSPRLAASCHSGESRNPGILTGCRIKSGMTSDTPLLAAG
jgi:hypothetical protein